MSIKVITGKVRFSYCHVFKPAAMAEGQTPKYSVSIIISKDDKLTIDKINKAIEFNFYKPASINAGFNFKSFGLFQVFSEETKHCFI